MNYADYFKSLTPHKDEKEHIAHVFEEAKEKGFSERDLAYFERLMADSATILLTYWVWKS